MDTCMLVTVVIVKLNPHVAFAALQALLCALYRYYLILTMG